MSGRGKVISRHVNVPGRARHHGLRCTAWFRTIDRVTDWWNLTWRIHVDLMRTAGYTCP